MPRRRYGSPPEVHHERAQRHVREIRRLTGVLREQLKSPPDCVQAAYIARRISEMGGAYMIDSYDGNRRGLRSSSGGRGPRQLFERFIKACVIKPRSAAAERKMRAVWRKS